MCPLEVCLDYPSTEKRRESISLFFDNLSDPLCNGPWCPCIYACYNMQMLCACRLYHMDVVFYVWIFVTMSWYCLYGDCIINLQTVCRNNIRELAHNYDYFHHNLQLLLWLAYACLLIGIYASITLCMVVTKHEWNRVRNRPQYNLIITRFLTSCHSCRYFWMWLDASWFCLML